MATEYIILLVTWWTYTPGILFVEVHKITIIKTTCCSGYDGQLVAIMLSN
jgi:hypothetical protein